MDRRRVTNVKGGHKTTAQLDCFSGTESWEYSAVHCHEVISAACSRGYFSGTCPNERWSFGAGRKVKKAEAWVVNALALSRHQALTDGGQVLRHYWEGTTRNLDFGTDASPAGALGTLPFPAQAALAEYLGWSAAAGLRSGHTREARVPPY